MKNLIILTICLFAMGAAFNSCEKNEDLCSSGTDVNLGLIAMDYDFGTCFTDVGMLNQQYVVRDEATFSELAFLPHNSSDCADAQVPAIDFSRYSLLGMYAEGTCTVFYTREVTKNEANKTYNYKVSTQECGFCESLSFSMNWVLIPKIQEGYTITFGR